VRRFRKILRGLVTTGEHVYRVQAYNGNDVRALKRIESRDKAS